MPIRGQEILGPLDPFLERSGPPGQVLLGLRREALEAVLVASPEGDGMVERVAVKPTLRENASSLRELAEKATGRTNVGVGFGHEGI